MDARIAQSLTHKADAAAVAGAGAAIGSNADVCVDVCIDARADACVDASLVAGANADAGTHANAGSSAAAAGARRRIDPRVSLLGLVFVNLAAFFTTSMPLIAGMMVFDCVLMTAVGKWKMAIAWLCGYALVYWGGVGLIMLGPTFQGFALCFVYLSRMFPIGAFAALMITTTYVGEMAYALQSLGLPSRFAVAVCVALRFFPTAAREAKAVHEAMLTRGIRLTPANIVRHPATVMENFFVPYIHRISTTADELGNAVMVRAIESSGKRTCYHPMKIGALDVAVLCGTLFFLVAGIVGRFM